MLVVMCTSHHVMARRAISSTLRFPCIHSFFGSSLPLPLLFLGGHMERTVEQLLTMDIPQSGDTPKGLPSQAAVKSEEREREYLVLLHQ